MNARFLLCDMSKRIWNNWAFLHLLLESPSLLQKKSLLRTATAEQAKALSEIIANTLAGSLPIPPAGRNKLYRFRKVLREVAGKVISLKRRKNLLTKHIRQVLTLLSYIQPALKLMKK